MALVTRTNDPDDYCRSSFSLRPHDVAGSRLQPTILPVLPIAGQQKWQRRSEDARDAPGGHRERQATPDCPFWQYKIGPMLKLFLFYVPIMGYGDRFCTID